MNSNFRIFLKQSGPGVKPWPGALWYSQGWAEILITREGTSPISLDASMVFYASLSLGVFRFVSEYCFVLVQCLRELE